MIKFILFLLVAMPTLAYGQISIGYGGEQLCQVEKDDVSIKADLHVAAELLRAAGELNPSTCFMHLRFLVVAAHHTDRPIVTPIQNVPINMVYRDPGKNIELRCQIRPLFSTPPELPAELLQEIQYARTYEQVAGVIHRIWSLFNGFEDFVTLECPTS